MIVIRHVLSWAIALFLIAMFLQAAIHPLPNPPAGSVKFFDPPGDNIIFQTLASRSGIGLFEPTGRFIVGLGELLAAFLLLIPFTRRLGAVLSFLILAAAVGFHMSPWLGREVPLSLTPNDGATDGGALFMLAISMLVASLLVMVVHPGRDDR